MKNKTNIFILLRNAIVQSNTHNSHTLQAYWARTNKADLTNSSFSVREGSTKGFTSSKCRCREEKDNKHKQEEMFDVHFSIFNLLVSIFLIIIAFLFQIKADKQRNLFLENSILGV